MRDPNDFVEELFRKGLTPAEIVRYGCERRKQSREAALAAVLRFFARQGLALDRKALERNCDALFGEPPAGRS